MPYRTSEYRELMDVKYTMTDDELWEAVREWLENHQIAGVAGDLSKAERRIVFSNGTRSNTAGIGFEVFVKNL